MQLRKKREKRMKKRKSKLPDFSKMSYKEEATWWDTHDLGDYWDELEDVEIVFDLKKPRTESVVVRLQEDFKERLEKIARSRGLNLSGLIRMWLLENYKRLGETTR